ncbi:MAG: hypothetical protein KTR31_00530 [Myxococcales bacterium]|nr:hypothetical protein [Myxococcales bacterium]
MRPGAVATRPGQTYFVPGVRIHKLGKLHRGRDEGVEITEAQHDILEVSVTQVHHGVGQYCITLSNWHDTLPADRRAPRPARQANERVVNGTPVWPRFKYNDFSLFQFGERLRIDMRYFPDPVDELDRDTRNNHRWVPMISGPISDITFDFTEKDGNIVKICGEDDLCPLKDKNPRKCDYWAVPEKKIVEDVLKRGDYPLPPVTRDLPAFTEDDAKALAEAHFEGTSYLDYLMKFGDRLDCEVFLEFADLNEPESGVQFHFERARSRLPPDKTLRHVHVVERGLNLHHFDPVISLVDQYTSVTVCGRNRVSTSPTRVECTRPPAGTTATQYLQDELHTDPTKADPPLLAGADWRLRHLRANPHTEINQRGLDPERACVMADAYFRQNARKFLHADVETLGLPRLRPGRHLEIRGMRDPFDGFYYVEKAVHTYGANGLRTRTHVRRPGMPHPDDGGFR